MREIKFRAWDVEGKCWIPEDSFLISHKGKTWTVGHSNDSGDHWVEEVIDYILVQYTGLKDKNGKEIFEGDIIKANLESWLGYSTQKIVSVIFKNGCFGISDDNDFKPFYGADSQQLEIIGNVFENPELVKP